MYNKRKGGVSVIIAQKRNHLWLILFVLVLTSNTLIYHTSLYETLGIHNAPEVVIGSLLDILIVAPILLCLYLKKFNWKLAVVLFAGASIFATLAIPNALLAPYKFITNTGIFLEVAIISFEVLLIILFVTYLPKLIKQVRQDERPLVFSFNTAVEQRSKNPVIKVLSSELLVFYYAFASWKKKPMEGVSLHQKSSYVAFQVMLLHAIVLESLGFHWWLHSKAPIVSIILLLLNVYGFIFILADLQAMRLNRIQHDHKGFYIPFGLMKHAYINYENIEEVILDKDELRLKRRKDCVEFICRDFEEVFPQVILKMKEPQQVRFIYGMKKSYRFVAIKCDDSNFFIEKLQKEVK